MRKQLLALLSMIGLAGWTVPAHAQVLKGSKEATKKASTVKQAKAKKETATAASHAAMKEHKAASDASAGKTNGHIKMEKGAAEANSAKTNVHIKMKKNAAESAAAKGAAKK